jgi:hypothetical protein
LRKARPSKPSGGLSFDLQSSIRVAIKFGWLRQRYPAIDRQVNAGHEFGILRREEQDRPGNIVRLCRTAQACVLERLISRSFP